MSTASPQRLLYVALALLLPLILWPLPFDSAGAKSLQNTAHAPVFGALALILFDVQRHLDRHGRYCRWHYALAGAGAVLLGVLAEIIQSLVGRDASLNDVYTDLLGITAALVLTAAFDPVVGNRASRVVLRAGLLLLFAAAVYAIVQPITHVAAAYWVRDRAFPELADWTSPAGRRFLRPVNASIDAAALPSRWLRDAGRPSAYLRAEPGARHFGLAIVEPLRDWRGHQALLVDVTNPAKRTLDLTVRVHDGQHDQRHLDRFNRSYRIAPETRRQLRITLAEIAAGPRDRRMDLSDVAGVIVFRSRPGPDAFYLNRVRLE